MDARNLVEQLMEASDRLSIAQKNRLRRKFEGFHPGTVSKTNEYHSRFFKTVMRFGHPKPRRMERDFRVFPWSCLEQMIKRIIAKHCVFPSETNNRIPWRKRRLNSDNIPVASSKVPGIRSDRPRTYLPWSEDTLFKTVKDLNADEEVREKLLGVVPDLLGAFALKTGYAISIDAHRGAEYFIEKHHQEANSTQE
ncbi:hypothetical protein HDV63DRAFT_414960 [Trichoderma sp. SZMC 28014]